MKTVVVVDQHASIRQMISILIGQEGSYTVAGEAGTGWEGLKLCRKLSPQILIVDLSLPELSGLELLRTLRAEASATRFLIYTGAVCQELLMDALRARPHGFVHKTDSWPTFREALHTVARGGTYLTPFATSIMDRYRGEPETGHPLTSRERMVLQMIAEGLSNKEMAERLSLSSKTVEHHRAQVMDKLNLHNVATLTRYAIRQGLVPADP